MLKVKLMAGTGGGAQLVMKRGARMTAKRPEHPIDIDSSSESDSGAQAPAPKKIKEEPGPVASGSGSGARPAVVIAASKKSARGVVAGLQGVVVAFRERAERLRVEADELATMAGTVQEKLDEVLASYK